MSDTKDAMVRVTISVELVQPNRLRPRSYWAHFECTQHEAEGLRFEEMGLRYLWPAFRAAIGRWKDAHA